MAPGPLLPSSRWFLRVPGYGSLWRPGRGWLPLPDPASGDIPSILMFLSAHSLSEMPFTFLNFSEGELKCIAMKKVLMAMAPPGTSDSSRLVEGLLRLKASEADLSKELHLMARVEHALSKMHRELCAMLFIMPSCASLFNRRPGVEITDLLSELNQYVLLRCAEEDNFLSKNENLVGFAGRGALGAVHTPGCIAEMCSKWFVLSIYEALLGGIALHLMSEVNSYYRRVNEWADSCTIGWEIGSKTLMEYDVVAAKAEGVRLRDDFLKKAALEPPEVLRMIDCKGTCKEGRVVLMDWKDCAQEIGYSAISHTYGQAVYEVFNCVCASICRSPNILPRYSLNMICPHDPTALDAASTTHNQTVKDILNMCGILRAAGVDYVWHDGACVAQFDEEEVRATIEHIGWIYANARETIVFLHYVGKPMAPIRPSDVEDGMVCRWHTRVWTLQEAALSKQRRYCIRVGTNGMGDPCKSPEEVVEMVGHWYDDKSSKVEVVEEESFFEMLKWLSFILAPYRSLVVASCRTDVEHHKILMIKMLTIWAMCVDSLVETLQSICFSFPTADEALQQCGKRESKHRGDRMNSILTLAGVKGFVAAKDSNVEDSTLQFFERQGQKGLARALFSINIFSRVLEHPAHELRRCKWLPLLGKTFFSAYKDGSENGMRLRVLGDGRMVEVMRGDQSGDQLLCIKVRIVVMPPDRELVYVKPGGEESGIDAVFRSLISQASNVLDMELVFSGGLPLLALPEAPSYCVGSMITPLVNLSEAPTSLISPSHLEEERLLKEKESFDAHLVTTSRGVGDRMLILHGNNILHGEVSKIGFFLPHDPFLKYFRELMLVSKIKLEKVTII